MTRTSKALKRLGVGGLAAVTIGAGIPAFFATAANAAPASGIGVAAKTRNTGATGTCIPYIISLTGVSSSDTTGNKVNIIITDPSGTGTPAAPGSNTSAQFCQTDKNNLLIPTSSQSNATTPNTPAATPVTFTAAPAPPNPQPAGTNPTLQANQREETITTMAGQSTIQFGVFDLEREVVAIQTFVDQNGDEQLTPATSTTSGEPSATTTATFTAGSVAQDMTTNPGAFDQAANDAVNKGGLTATQSATQKQSAVANPGAGKQIFTLTAVNANGDAVRGAKVEYTVNSGGANFNTASGASNSFTCGSVTDNNGQTVCTVSTPKAGNDSITFFINQTNGGTGSTAGTSSADPQEPQVTVAATTRPDATEGRNVTLTPNGGSFVQGQTVTYAAKVVDKNGTPVQGVGVQFTLSGPGVFPDYGSTDTNNGFGNTPFTGADGIARVRATVSNNETGAQTVTANIDETTFSFGSAANQCKNAAGTPAGAGAGNCTATATNTFTTQPSQSPSATATATASSTATATATQTTTATASPTTPACKTTNVVVNTKSINATGLASVTATGAAPGSIVELQGYSQNHYLTANFDNDPTPVDRSKVADQNGSVTFSDIRPASNTRLRARQKGCTYTGNSDVINVRAQETLQVSRNAKRKYTFSGVSIPARPGGLIISLYRVSGGSETLIGQDRADAGSSDGGTPAKYSITLTLPTSYGSSSVFVVKTGQDAQNAPGRSNSRTLTIS